MLMWLLYVGEIRTFCMRPSYGNNYFGFRRNYPHVCPFYLNAAAASGEFEQSNADHYRQSNIVSDFKTAPMCLRGNITCGLSAVDRNSSVATGFLGNLVCVQTVCIRLCFLLHTPHKSPGTRPSCDLQ